jgi:hypothetical protein
MTIIEAINGIFKPCFRDLTTWHTWIVVLKLLFGLRLTKKELKLYRRLTGRSKLPEGRFEGFKELFVIAGRRAGKSFIMAITAVFLALFFDYQQYLTFGEQAVIMIVASDRQQARVIFNYIIGILHSNEILRACIVSQTKERISLNSGIDIEIVTASFRTIRGRTIVAAICDEIAFWMVDGANPDHEIINAIRPSMVTIPTSKLICVSSPYSRKGVLWDAHKDYFGKDDEREVLVVQGATRTFNPTVSEAFIQKELQKDEAAAKAEWLAEFRGDIEGFVTREMVEQVVVSGRFELPPVSGLSYSAFVDPAGGSGKDSMALAVSHVELRSGLKVLDCVREVRPPFSPDQVVRQFVQTLKRYRVNVVVGDRYAGEWPRERFLSSGVKYRVADKTKSQLYGELLPLLTSQECELLDNPRLVNQLVSLERRTGRSGKDTIDHPPRSHDDLANVCAGALVGISVRRAGTFRPERSRRKSRIRRMFPDAVTGSVRSFDRASGEIIKLR